MGATLLWLATLNVLLIKMIQPGKRLELPSHVFAEDNSEFEQEINQLRTYQGQSDVYVINDKGSITAPTFGGGANAMVTELLGEAATISSDFGGNPPYEKMNEISNITFKHWLEQSNVLFIIGGKANNTDIYETFRAIGDGLRGFFQTNGPKPLFCRSWPRWTQPDKGNGLFT